MNFSNVKKWVIPEGDVKMVIDSNNRVIWSKAVYFYIEDVSGSANTLTIKKNQYNAPTIEVFASTDTVNWVSMGTTNTVGITATIPANGKLYLKAIAGTWGDYIGGADNRISASGRHNVGGNIMSLLYGDNFEGKGIDQTTTSTFTTLFLGNTNLVSAGELSMPANDLVDACYAGMFESCTSLTTPPELPATKLYGRCYSEMFYGCTSLTKAPALPATTLYYQCYINMFGDCRALFTAPVLPATKLAGSCYLRMFYNCPISRIVTYAQDISASRCTENWLESVYYKGDFYNLGGASYTSGASGIPTGWTEHTSL